MNAARCESFVNGLVSVRGVIDPQGVTKVRSALWTNAIETCATNTAAQRGVKEVLGVSRGSCIAICYVGASHDQVPPLATVECCCDLHQPFDDDGAASAQLSFGRGASKIRLSRNRRILFPFLEAKVSIKSIKSIRFFC